MLHIKNILNRRIKGSGHVGKQIEIAIVIRKVENILTEFFSPAICKNIQVISIKDKILTISCTSSALAQELKLQKKSLIDRTNNHFGQSVITEIIIKF